jgi:hypothetical protein
MQIMIYNPRKFFRLCLTSLLVFCFVLGSIKPSLSIFRSIASGKEEISYVMFTITPPLSAQATVKILPFYVDSNLVDFAPSDISETLFEELNWNKSGIKNNSKTYLIGEIQYFNNFPVVGILMRKSEIKQVRKLLNANYIYEVPKSLARTYLKIIRHFDNILNKSKNLENSFINLSLQPPTPSPFNKKEAINIATKIMSDKGVVIVMAAGNFGEFGDNTLSSWSVAPWVIGVGASYPDGKKLWEKSSRGIPGDFLYHPTVVAPGVNVKTKINIPGIKGLVGIEHLAGTSIATAFITSIAAQCSVFINKLATNTTKMNKLKKEVKLKLGIEIKSIVSNPRTIKKMIENMAKKMPGCKTHEIGFGFVDEEIALKYFNNFGFSNFAKVFALHD